MEFSMDWNCSLVETSLLSIYEAVAQSSVLKKKKFITTREALSSV